MRGRGTNLVVFLSVAAALTLAGPAGASSTTCPVWVPQPPNVGTGNNFLTGVVALPSCNAVAVGVYSKGSFYRTLIERWNGRAWKIQPSPNLGSDSNDLRGVTATSSRNVWAVGTYRTNGYRTLIEHWDGAAWAVQPSPSPGAHGGVLYGVAAISPTDAWAVGDIIGSERDRTLVEHWDGAAWSTESSPNAGSGYNYLLALSAVSATDVWAVGSHSSRSGATNRTLIEHWDGKAWTVEPSPNVGVEDNTLSHVVATSPTNAWAVGSYRHGTSFRALIEHWNGTDWAVQPSPKIQGSLLFGVTALSASDAWAVGRRPGGALVEHWNGIAWKIVTRPKLQSKNGSPFAVDATSVRNVWAVGERYDPMSRALRTFVRHCC